MYCSQIQCNGELPEIWVSEWPEPKVDRRPAAAAREKRAGRSALSGTITRTTRSALSGTATCIQLLEYPIPRAHSRPAARHTLRGIIDPLMSRQPRIF